MYNMNIEERIEKLENENKELRKMLEKVAEVAWRAGEGISSDRDVLYDVEVFVKDSWEKRPIYWRTEARNKRYKK